MKISTSNLKYDPHIFLAVSNDNRKIELEIYNYSSKKLVRIFSEKKSFSISSLNFFWGLTSFSEDKESVNVGKGGTYIFELFI